MIKINLLPFRTARKKENIRRQISVFLLVVLLSTVALVWYTTVINKQIITVKQKTEQVKHQILKYKEKADRVEKIKKDLKILDEKLEVVSSLGKQKNKQFVLFDGMTEFIIPERMWLESFKTDANSVTIKGIAFDNPTIADFMQKLEKSPLFGNVDLKTAKMKKFSGGEMLKSFELFCEKEKSKEEKEQEKNEQVK